jgi:integrase
MAVLRLNEATIAALPIPPTGKNRVYRDSELRGLGVRVTSSGNRSFLLCYSHQGIETRMPIGTWQKGQGTLEVARKIAAKHLLTLMTGTDPMGERKSTVELARLARELAARESTFEKLCHRYLTEHAITKRTLRADELRIQKLLVPAWGKRKVKDIKRADVDEILTPVVLAGKLSEANHRHALIRKIFSFAVDKGIIDFHPCLRMRAPGGPTRVRDRALTTPAELRLLDHITSKSVWRRLIGESEARALKLMALTGCRPTEAAELQWKEIDLEEKLWTLPAVRSKNKRPHTIPLVEEAAALLKACLPAAGDFVFVGQRSSHTSENRLAGALRKVFSRLGKIRMAPFAPHDLRRTVETNLASLKVPKEYRDRVLNHLDGSVGGRHYNKYEYLDEKRQALELWARHFKAKSERTGGNNVIAFNRYGT